MLPLDGVLCTALALSGGTRSAPAASHVRALYVKPTLAVIVVCLIGGKVSLHLGNGLSVGISAIGQPNRQM